MELIIFSDSHGRILSGTKNGTATPTSGLDRLATYVNQLKSQSQELFIINNGDAIQGTPLVDLHTFESNPSKKRKHPINILHDYIGLNCFIPGNHEFNFGLEYLTKVREESGIPWLAANIYHKQTQKHLFQPYKIFTTKTLTIGVVGLITDFVPKWENDRAIRELEFRNVLQVCEEYLPVVRPMCDFLIVAYHGGLKKNPVTGEIWSVGDTSENQAIEIWEMFPEIDLLITGHQHRQFIYMPDNPNRSPIVQPSSYANHWIHFRIHQLKKSLSKTNRKFRISEEPGIVDSGLFTPDTKLERLLFEHVQATEKVLHKPLGMVDNSFHIVNPMTDVWLKKHPLIQWINELMCQLTNVEISAIPLLSPELKGLSGSVSIREILSFFHFQDTVCVLEISGSILKQALEKAAEFFERRQLNNGDVIIDINPDWRKSRVLSYNYDMWEGIDYIFDIRNPIGERLVSAKIKGSTIDDDETIHVAVTSYRAAGAFYTMFSPEMMIKEYPTRITDLMIQDLLDKKNLVKQPIQNFTIIY